MVYDIWFIPPSLQNKYKKLNNSNTGDKGLFDCLTEAFGELAIDPDQGAHIPRDRIPKKYKKIDPSMKKSCWKYDLPNAWRLIYFIANDNKSRYVGIVGWMTHDEYARDFNYK